MLISNCAGTSVQSVQSVQFVRSFVVLQILILPRLGPGSARRYGSGPTAVAPALGKLKFEILTIPKPARSIDQSIDRSIDRSIDQSIDRSINRSIDQSINRSIDQSINRSIDRSINQSIDRSIDQSIERRTNERRRTIMVAPLSL